MYRILTASADTYITNKIINNNYRATDSNTGQAATIDLFKLYSESTSGSDINPKEISRGLVKFNLKPLRDMTSSFLDISHASFNCTLKLMDVYGGQTTPSNFTMLVAPLSKSWDEGIGRDVVTFSDLDSSNFVTSSASGNTAVAWEITGANKEGLLDSDNIDYITSGTLKTEDGIVELFKTQTFSSGEEDLSVDVTQIISATIGNLIPDYGFRISYSGTQETDTATRFVKRFGSTQHSNFYKRPKLIVKFDDTIQDHHESFFFDISGSLFLNNFHRGAFSNILTGTRGRVQGVSGSNSLLLRMTSGSTSRGTFFEKYITASQHIIGNNHISGVYSASFCMPSFTGTNPPFRNTVQFNSALVNEIKNAGSATFTEIWSSLDRTVGYLTASLVINSVNRTSFNNESSRLLLSITNLKDEYRFDDKVKFNVFAEDIDRPVKSKKLPFETKSQILTSLYYRLRDVQSGDIVIPFDKASNGTLCSTDSNGMYFEIYMNSLPKGRLFTIDFLLTEKGVDQVFTDVAAKFKVI